MPKPAVPIEHKVIHTTAIAGILGIAIAALNGLAAQSQLINWLPATWQAIILAVVPMLLTLAAGYAAPHTDRAATPTAADLDAEAAAYHAGDA